MLTFKTLWDNHPTTKKEDYPCKSKQGVPNFSNQCAIRMSVALKDSGMKMGSYRGALCWYGHKHVLRVEELVQWLKGQRHEVGSATKYKPGKNAKDAVSGKTGIVACINFWGAGNQGDHIDLWDGVNMRNGSPDYFDGSQEVYFWEIQ